MDVYQNLVNEYCLSVLYSVANWSTPDLNRHDETKKKSHSSGRKDLDAGRLFKLLGSPTSNAADGIQPKGFFTGNLTASDIKPIPCDLQPSQLAGTKDTTCQWRESAPAEVFCSECNLPVCVGGGCDADAHNNTPQHIRIPAAAKAGSEPTARTGSSPTPHARDSAAVETNRLKVSNRAHMSQMSTTRERNGQAASTKDGDAQPIPQCSW